MSTQFAQDFREVFCIFWYDGPIESHYRDMVTGTDYIVVWTDVDTETHYWFAIELTKETLQQFMANEISLHQAMKIAPKIWNCSGAWLEDGKIASGTLMAFEDIKPENMPTEDSFHDLPHDTVDAWRAKL